jgi:hypothetical protein
MCDSDNCTSINIITSDIDIKINNYNNYNDDDNNDTNNNGNNPSNKDNTNIQSSTTIDLVLIKLNKDIIIQRKEIIEKIFMNDLINSMKYNQFFTSAVVVENHLKNNIVCYRERSNLEHIHKEEVENLSNCLKKKITLRRSNLLFTTSNDDDIDNELILSDKIKEVIKRAEILLQLRQAVLVENWTSGDCNCENNREIETYTVENVLLVWYNNISWPTSSYGSEEVKIISNTLFNNALFDKYLTYSSYETNFNKNKQNNDINTINDYENNLLELLSNNDTSPLYKASYSCSQLINEKISKCEILFNLTLISEGGNVRALKMLTNSFLFPG